MAENPVTVDLSRLRAVANRVDRSANALARFQFPGLDADELRGSTVGGIVSPARVAARLEVVNPAMRRWATVARRSADAFENADHDNAGRM